MSKPTLRKNGKPYTPAERAKRYRISKKRQDKLAQRLARQPQRIEAPQPVVIHPISVQAVSEAHLASASVDAIITDPPYAKADIPLHGELAQFAMRVLKPSGWCVVMIGDLYQDDIVALMRPTGLQPWGRLYVVFPRNGYHARIGHRFQVVKPMVVFQKPPASPLTERWGPNAIFVDDYQKDLHEWQQPQSLFETLVHRFTEEGQLVVDPFAGSGTTLKAALALGRRAWGCDNGSADHLRTPNFSKT